MKHAARMAILAVLTTLVGCPLTTKYTVGGYLTGLRGAGLVLQVNGGNDLALVSNGAFVFGRGVNDGSAYTVTVKTQPGNPAQTCSVRNGAGSINRASVANVIVSCTQAARFVYVANSLENTITGFAVDSANGALLPLAGAPFADTGTTPAGVTIDANGNFLYVANAGSNDVSVYALDFFTGTPIATGLPLAAGVSPVAVAIDPTNRFLYVADSGDGTVYGYALDGTTGGGTAIPGSPFLVGNQPSALAVDPSGNFLYVTNFLDGTVVSAYIDPISGTLAAVAGSPFGTGKGPAALAVDPTSSYLYVANSVAGSVSSYAVNETAGALAPTTGSPLATGASPAALAVDPTGRYLYAANTPAANQIGVYYLTPTNGALGAASTATAGAAPTGLAIDPAGTYLYVADSGASAVSMYSIDAASGALTQVKGSPFLSGLGARALAVY